MPKYFYKCTNSECAKIFEIVHSMKEKLQTCSECVADCKEDFLVERVPSTSISVSKTTSASSHTTKPGALVKKNIEEFRKALKEEQKRLRDVEYK